MSVVYLNGVFNSNSNWFTVVNNISKNLYRNSTKGIINNPIQSVNTAKHEQTYRVIYGAMPILEINALNHSLNKL